MNKLLIITPLASLVAAFAEPVAPPAPVGPDAPTAPASSAALAKALQQRRQFKPVDEGTFSITPVKDSTGLTFPPKIPGDDFDGTPHLIVFPKSEQESFKRLCPDSAYGFGTPEDPLRTYARVYFHTTKEGVAYELKTDLKSKDLGDFPLNMASVKTNFLKSITGFVGRGCSNAPYSKIISSLHKDSEAHGWSSLSSPEALSKQRNLPRPEGTEAMLAAIRVSLGKQEIMLTFFESKITNEERPFLFTYSFIFDKEWKFYSVSKCINGASPLEFDRLFIKKPIYLAK